MPPESPRPVRAGGDRCPGALRLHEAADGLLARMRIPGGLLTAAQVEALVDASLCLGDGRISLTTRGNVEIRGIGVDDEDRLASLLDGAGLLPSPSHERVRNLVVSPAAGLDGEGHAGSLVEVVRAFDALLCATARAADLSGRFLFGLDDGRGDVLPLDPDLAALWISPQKAELVVGGARVLAVPSDDVPAALVAAAVAFLDARDDRGETGWRFADLSSPAPVVAAVVDAVAARFPAARPVDEHAPAEADVTMPPPGPIGDGAAHLMLRLGTAPAQTWGALAAVARTGDGLIRTTPARGLVVAGLSPQSRDALLDRAPGLGLVADPADAYAGVSACTGLPGCEKSRADVHADVHAALTRTGVTGPRPLPVHVSGCDRRCGHPRRPHDEAVASDSGYATGRADGSPATGAPLPEGRDDLADLLTPTHA